jgi:hypothetical protein
VEPAALWDFAFAAELSTLIKLSTQEWLHLPAVSYIYKHPPIGVAPRWLLQSTVVDKGVCQLGLPRYSSSAPRLKQSRFAQTMIFFNGLSLAGTRQNPPISGTHANHENLCPGSWKPHEPVYCQHTTENSVFI